MTLTADGPIGMRDVTFEFLADVRTPLTEFVRGGEFVPDMGAGFPNEDVPTTPPLALTNFYEATRNPNPVQLQDGVLSQPEVEVISSSREGLFVLAYNGIALPVPGDSRFVIDIKFKCGPTFSPYDAGTVIATGPSRTYENCRLNADILIGLTGANPLFASDGNMMSQFFGARVRFWDSLSSNRSFGPGNVTFAGDSSIFLQTDGIDTGYDDVRPDTSSFTRIRLTRGENVQFSGGLWQAQWQLSVFKDDNFTDLFQRVDTRGIFAAPYNTFGYLIFANNNPTVDGTNIGDVDVSFEYIRGFVGGSVAPW